MARGAFIDGLGKNVLEISVSIGELVLNCTVNTDLAGNYESPPPNMCKKVDTCRDSFWVIGLIIMAPLNKPEDWTHFELSMEMETPGTGQMHKDVKRALQMAGKAISLSFWLHS